MSPEQLGKEARSPRMRGEYCVLQYAGPGRPVVNIGVLLLDPVSDKLYLRMRSDWRGVAEPSEAQVLALLEDDLRSKANRMGGLNLLESLEDRLSSAIRMTDRQPIAVEEFGEALAQLYRLHVGSQ